jgi:hypothetical protein
VQFIENDAKLKFHECSVNDDLIYGVLFKAKSVMSYELFNKDLCSTEEKKRIEQFEEQQVTLMKLFSLLFTNKFTTKFMDMQQVDAIEHKKLVCHRDKLCGMSNTKITKGELLEGVRFLNKNGIIVGEIMISSANVFGRVSPLELLSLFWSVKNCLQDVETLTKALLLDVESSKFSTKQKILKITKLDGPLQRFLLTLILQWTVLKDCIICHQRRTNFKK